MKGQIGEIIVVGIVSLVFIAIVSFFGLIAMNILFGFDWDPFPAKGSATGVISFQESVNGVTRICWRDTPYADCEYMNAESDKKYIPGNYLIEYTCASTKWGWYNNLCSITNSTYLNQTK